MAGEDQPHDRSALLDFVERHWRDLTLREARSLRIEVLEAKALLFPGVKSSLTYR